jgi:hypothetical protein
MKNYIFRKPVLLLSSGKERTYYVVPLRHSQRHSLGWCRKTAVSGPPEYVVALPEGGSSAEVRNVVLP